MTDTNTIVTTEGTPEMILMKRDPERVPGMGMTKMLVPANEVASYEKAGWIKADDE